MSLLPRSLFGRLALLMAGGLVLTQLIGATLHLTERQRTLGAVVSQEFAQRVAAVHRAIDSQPAGERAALVTPMARTSPAFTSGSAEGMLSKIISMRPPSRSGTACARPL